MSKTTRFNAFEINCAGHQWPGQWAHPRDRSWQYKNLEHWTDLVKHVETNAIVSAVEHFSGGDKAWIIDELAKWGGVGDMGPVFVGGSPTTEADILQQWVEATDVDGFNLAYAVAHETSDDVVHDLAPELQRRGIYPTAYQPGTLREKLFGESARLPDEHPAAQFRNRGETRREGSNHRFPNRAGAQG